MHKLHARKRKLRNYSQYHYSIVVDHAGVTWLAMAPTTKLDYAMRLFLQFSFCRSVFTTSTSANLVEQ